MVSKQIIHDIIVKCSNDEVRGKLASMSSDEKNERLQGKLNPFEKENYKYLLKEFRHYTELYEQIKNDENNQSLKKDIEEDILPFLESEIFNYEKRIFRGYDLNKNIGNVPNYDINDFQSDEVIEYRAFGEVLYGKMEQAQIDAQKDIVFSNDELGAVKGYFHHDSTYINSDLDHKYGQNSSNMSNDSYYDLKSEEERNLQHESNKSRIKNIDSAIDKTDGLIVGTVLYHGTQHSSIVNMHTRVGDKINLKSYISASFQEKVGQDYGEKVLGRGVNSVKSLYVKFLAPKGTKGLCGNDKSHGELSKFNAEHEYLLGRGNKGTVVDIDYNNGVVTVLLE